MNSLVKNKKPEDGIFGITEENFLPFALEIFRFQYANNKVYRQYCDLLKINADKISNIQDIPFLPVRFFKSHQVTTTEFNPEIIFESSGTTQTINSKHFVKDISLYEKSFNEAFRLFYKDPSEWCIIALLPSYLERNNSSLVMMVDKLVRQTGNSESGFYLNEGGKLHNVLTALEKTKQRTLLIGVTYALLDLAEQWPMPLHSTIIMETGGMKGRREEITRAQVHKILCERFSLENIHSEYGMTELLSQAYSNGGGIFKCPPWMKVLIREEDDPFAVHATGKEGSITGAVNVIDLANIYSCSFIAIDDAGKLYPDGSFEIMGRLDNSDIRGCSLLSL